MSAETEGPGGAAWARGRSSYLRLAGRDASLIADRDFMVRCFLEDVRRLSAELPPVPPRPVAAGAGRAAGAVVRLVTWNINILMGPDGRGRADPEAAAAVLEALGADVLALQEAPAAGLDRMWNEAYAEPVARVEALAQRLARSGYEILRSPADNATLLATRLPVVYTENGPVLDESPVRSVNGQSVWQEVRAARYAELALPGGPAGRTLAVYATHLHHKDVEVGPRGAGVRRREAAALLAHQRARSAAAAASVGAGGAGPLATVVLADFNQPRAQDHEAEEWQVVVEGLARPAVAQPADDGVSGLLEAAGFRCSFDAVGGPPCRAPFTHWTGTAIDFAYVRASPCACARPLGVHVVPTPLSDHLPVVTDLLIGADAAA